MQIFSLFLKKNAKKFGSLIFVRTFAIPNEKNGTKRRSSSVGRAQPCQGWGREFEPRLLLQNKIKGHLRMTLNFEKYSPDGVQSYVSRPCAQGRLFYFTEKQRASTRSTLSAFITVR